MKPLPRTTGKSGFNPSGFTLVEVLATLLLIAIVLPVVNNAIVAASSAGSEARHRTEAAGLAQSKLSELIVTAAWNGGIQAGDFGPDWRGYRWQATAASWPNDTQGVGLSQLDLTVYWQSRNREESVTVSSLVYIRPVPASSS